MRVSRRVRRIDKLRGYLIRAVRGPQPPSTFQLLLREGRASVGIGTYGEPVVYSYDPVTRLDIGAYCSISRDVRVILGGEHHIDWVTTSPIRYLNRLPGWRGDELLRRKGDVQVGNDVWIGAGTLILSGVTVGDGAIVAAGSVLVSDAPHYAIVGGNPARVIRYRFPPEIRDRLAQIAWWNWPREEILRAADLLCSPDVEGFVDRYGAVDPSSPV